MDSVDDDEAGPPTDAVLAINAFASAPSVGFRRAHATGATTNAVNVTSADTGNALDQTQDALEGAPDARDSEARTIASAREVLPASKSKLAVGERRTTAA